MGGKVTIFLCDLDDLIDFWCLTPLSAIFHDLKSISLDM